MADSLSDLLPLKTGALHILLALAAGELHGYAIAKEIEAESLGRIVLGAATLYRTLAQLVADGWIVETKSHGTNDERRRSYRLTPLGRRVAIAEVSRLEAIVALARTRRLLPT